MGRRQTMMEKYKQQMKAYRKKRMKADNTPFLPADGNVFVMETLNPDKKIKAEVLKTRVKQHRKVIDSLGLSKKTQIIEGNHFDLPLETRYELCMIAAQAEPKKEIFEYLAKVLPSGSKVSYRLYEKGLRKLLDLSFCFESPAGFEEYLRVQPQPPVNNTVVFLKRE